MLVNWKATAGGPAWIAGFCFRFGSHQLNCCGKFKRHLLLHRYRSQYSLIRVVCQPIRGVHGSNRLSSWLQHFWPLVWLPFDAGNHYPILTEICDALEVDSFYRLGFSIVCYILGILLVRLLLWTSSNILHLDRVSDSAGAMQYLWIFWQKGFFFQQLWFMDAFTRTFLTVYTVLTRSQLWSVGFLFVFS